MDRVSGQLLQLATRFLAAARASRGVTTHGAGDTRPTRSRASGTKREGGPLRSLPERSRPGTRTASTTR
jgi:hypothetical protein